MVTDADRGLSVRTNATTGELIEAWFEHAAGDFSPKTVKETRGFIDRNLLPAVGARPADEAEVQRPRPLYRRLAGQRGSRSGGPLAPATVRRIHGILRRALAQGVTLGMARRQPGRADDAARASRSRRSRRRPRRRPRLASCDGRAESSPELACYLVLAAATGATTVRAGGAAMADSILGRHDPDRTRRRHGSGGARREGHQDPLRPPSRPRRGTSVVGAPEPDGRRAATCAELADNSFVFSNAADCSEPWYPDSVSTVPTPLRRRGTPDVRLHDLRHFVASSTARRRRRRPHRRRPARSPQRRDDAQRVRPLPRAGRPRRRRRHRPGDRRPTLPTR